MWKTQWRAIALAFPPYKPKSGLYNTKLRMLIIATGGTTLHRGPGGGGRGPASANFWISYCTPSCLQPNSHPSPLWKGLTVSRLSQVPKVNFRVEVLRTARVQGHLAFQNKLFIFPDYSLKTQKLRHSFNKVKAAMPVKGIRYSVLFPARLRGQDGETTFFTSPRGASSWLEWLPPHR